MPAKEYVDGTLRNGATRSSASLRGIPATRKTKPPTKNGPRHHPSPKIQPTTGQEECYWLLAFRVSPFFRLPPSLAFLLVGSGTFLEQRERERERGVNRIAIDRNRSSTTAVVIHSPRSLVASVDSSFSSPRFQLRMDQ